ncbi:response regulator [Desulfotalea psychrophila]|uniref:histidine kinase n=1 Tax=Desulfotalea psychrophila (strain LSv54 / DSM 12343) TaxID=177439 RepID=Q6AII8_DESPS|nr:response regulator [Desulfotalea psychrophila]CAG37842.1 related to two-component system sensory/regulatory protein (Ntr family) [Desulfotalea psychrophila LSv54]
MYYKQSVILIIDDEYSFRKTTKVYLERCGYGVLEAKTGREGLALCLRHDIDLVLLHSSLPDIHGVDVLQEIQLLLPELPVIMTSSGQDVAEIAKFLRFGALDYLHKPIIEPSILVHVVEKSLDYIRLSRENKKYQEALITQVAEKEEELSQLDRRFRNMVSSGQKFIRCTDLDRRDGMILQEFADDLGATKGCMYHVEEDHLTLAARLNTGFPSPQNIFFPLPESSLCAKVLREKRACMGHISKDISLQACACMSYSNDSFVIFPFLDQGGEVASLLVLYDKVADGNLPALFQDHDLELGEVLAYRVSDVRRRTDVTSALKRSEEFVLQAQKRDAIATLAGGIAHDFNNILSAIVGYTDLSLFTETCSDDVRSNLEQVQKASERARNLVRQILSLTRAETSEETVMGLSEVILEALKFVRVSLPTSVCIEHDIGEGLETVLANPDRIHQVVMNLCTNAAHAMQKGGGTLKVSYKKVDLDAGLHDIHELSGRTCLCLAVMDDGIGIESDLLEKIFDPYFTTKMQCEGTGLGLAVVQGIMDSLGGAIRVESQLGKGSSFYLYFPIVQDEQVQVKAHLSSPLLVGKERVLFVDDEQILAQMAGQMLTYLGYKPTVFTDSRVALEHFAENPDNYDLVITDLTMPFMSGLELSRRVKELGSEVPVILHTGYSSMVDVGEARAMGIAAIMIKPLTMSKLSRLVREAIDGNSRKYRRE